MVLMFRVTIKSSFSNRSVGAMVDVFAFREVDSEELSEGDDEFVA